MLGQQTSLAPTTSRLLRYVLATAPLLVAFAASLLVRFQPPYLLMAPMFVAVVICSYLGGRVQAFVVAIGATALTAVLLFLNGGLASSSPELFGFAVIAAFTAIRVNVSRQRNIRQRLETRQLEEMVKHAPFGLGLLGPDQAILRTNPALRRILGLPEQETGETKLPISASKREHWLRLEDGLRNGLPFSNLETLRVQKDGTKLYARISGTPIAENNLTSDGVVGVIAGVPGRGKGNLERHILESLVHHSANFICVMDLDQNVLFINDVGQQIVGLSEEDIPEDFRFVDLLAPKDMKTLTEVLLPRLRDGDADLQASLQLKSFRNEDLIPTLCNLFSVHDPDTDQPVCIACVAHLVGVPSAKKHQKETIGAPEATDNVVVAIALVDVSGQVLDCNEEFQKLVGYSVEELKTMRFASFVHPTDLAKGSARYQELTSGRLEHYRTTKRLVDRRGTVIRIKINISLIRDREGEPSYCVNHIETVPESGPASEQSS